MVGDDNSTWNEPPVIVENVRIRCPMNTVRLLHVTDD